MSLDCGLWRMYEVISLDRATIRSTYLLSTPLCLCGRRQAYVCCKLGLSTKIHTGLSSSDKISQVVTLNHCIFSPQLTRPPGSDFESLHFLASAHKTVLLVDLASRIGRFPSVSFHSF